MKGETPIPAVNDAIDKTDKAAHLPQEAAKAVADVLEAEAKKKIDEFVAKFWAKVEARGSAVHEAEPLSRTLDDDTRARSISTAERAICFIALRSRSRSVCISENLSTMASTRCRKRAPVK
ncbi:hypothetical protein XI09_05300 [Bradyrhizobium sp. CCBAU 11386]|uniref:hypothetical protein n=1 Tax=Bradyrhizobium sp. CCBAU 11386 TaxID=1630837 RepID=UPI00230226BB|nr:hypothetical protein [Bradyrhizobium sp. CCBAU 11386]MDA9504186.1 hypothetical protein [Bradyrhizobium sp. CCBAU 11386]